MPFLVCLATFERTTVKTEFLADNCQGAVGYMAVATTDTDEAMNILSKSLSSVNLRLLQVDDFQQYESADQVEEIDGHLAMNIRNWEDEKLTVWGTTHNYYADGEA